MEQDFANNLDVTGVMGDQILRVYFRIPGKITAEKIADKFGVHDYPYAIRSIEQWLSETSEIAKMLDINQIDWFNWEHFCGNWGGVSATEHDIVGEELKVFNCRALIITFMLREERLRYKDNPRLHKYIIHNNWPDLLKIKVEPSNIQFRKIKKILRFFYMETLVDKLYQYYRNYNRYS